MRQRTLCFIVPAHGRLEIARVCYRQLRRTCNALLERGIVASAVVIAEDENLELAQECDFATVEESNAQLGLKINHGYQTAAEYGAEFFVPFGSDDWIDHEWIRLPANGEVICTHLSSVVDPRARRLSRLNITYPGGDGVRVYPRKMLEAVNFRPAADDRRRAMDASTNAGVMGTANFRHVYHDTDPLCIVDFKSAENLNDYAGCARKFGREFPESRDVWGDLASIYPADSISEMQAVYGMVPA